MSTTGRSGAANGADGDVGDVTHDFNRRLSGDLAALSDFAHELAPRGNRPRDEFRPGEPGGRAIAGRINADPATVEHELGTFVLALIELIRRLLEKQALRRVEAGSLGEDDIERLGETFLRLEQRMDELKATFGVHDEDLDVTLGPLGNLMAG
jgi:Gas vesicle protein K